MGAEVAAWHSSANAYLVVWQRDGNVWARPFPPSLLLTNAQGRGTAVSPYRASQDDGRQTHFLLTDGLGSVRTAMVGNGRSPHPPPLLTNAQGRGTAVSPYRASQDDGRQTRFLLTDGLGSVRQEMAGGDLQTTTTYEPYGNLLTQTGTSGTTYGFTGEQEDEATGLVYLRARYYNPSLKVFLSRDPFPGMPTMPATQHGYSYAHNNPVNLTDPTGEIAIPMGGIAACTIFGYACAPVIVGGVIVGGVIIGGVIVYNVIQDAIANAPGVTGIDERVIGFGCPDVGVIPGTRTLPGEQLAQELWGPNAQLGRTPAPLSQGTPEPSRTPKPWPTIVPVGPRLSPTPSPTSEPDVIYRWGRDRAKSLTLHRPQDWETGLSFNAFPPPDGPYIKFRTNILRAAANDN